MISFQKKIFGNSSWCVCPQASHSDWSLRLDWEGLPEEGAEQGQLRIAAWAADPTGALSSRGQGRVNQGDKGKGGETWSPKGRDLAGDRLLVVQEVELGPARGGPKGCAKMRRNLQSSGSSQQHPCGSSMTRLKLISR